MIKQQLIFEIYESLKKDRAIMACYIFGSYIKGSANVESDLDIAFVVKNKKDISEKEIYDLIKDLHFPKDLDISVVDKKSSPLFLFQIISTGERIYAKNEEDIEYFESYVLKNYYDTQHMRNIYYGYLKDKYL